ncbi:hypothetical protein DQ04_13731000 [Trypanosoma grayi]|uniref:hypothetical protein n=1 Tax=Trypanosoma grayi TaxID=71804 RepID=UPI0004F448C2|nr:hypothetical protein DQ04_13731000 [Trypanosoma grayi]KEG06477.1 hypothetical protein DQ04_13731000 [Trypanosoma grayi]
MHVVSDLQKRPNKGRLKCEKRIIPLYDICSVIQLVCLVLHTTRLVIACRRTFVHSVWSRNPLELVPSLAWRTATCEYEARRGSLYAFQQVHVLLSSSNANEVFADHATYMCLAVYLSAFALALGIANRQAVEANFYNWTWRNFVVYKDLIAATEFALLCVVLRTALMANVAGSLLQDYLRHCGVVSESFLPFCGSTPLFLFVCAGFLTYVAGGAVYLWNALPKYGIMTEDEIRDYKEWLRERRAHVEEAKRVAEEAKRASMRLQLIIQAEDMPHKNNPALPLSLANSARLDMTMGNGRSMRHDASMRRDMFGTYHPNLSASHNTVPVNMPRRRDTLAPRQQQQQQQQSLRATEFSPHTVEVPLYATYTGGASFYSPRD